MSDSLPNLPAVPLTLEGAFVLHQFFHFDWTAWLTTAEADRAAIAAEFTALLRRLEQDATSTQHHSALFSQIGHKGDLVLLHLRRTLEEINQIELDLAQSRLHEFLSLHHSFISVVEQGLYESSRKTYEAAAACGHAPHTPEWNQSICDSLARASAAMAPRLYPSIPDLNYLCFYPMDRKRGEHINWYTQPLEARARMMHEHGTVGRRYADQVKQIITGAMGMDDWEWGVTLFANDPVAFKKIIYEMRFDQVSAVYGHFGPFYLALRLPVENFSVWLKGRL